jgi:hypothetical protein
MMEVSIRTTIDANLDGGVLRAGVEDWSAGVEFDAEHVAMVTCVLPRYATDRGKRKNRYR